MENLRIAFFSDPPVGLWAMSELFRAGFLLSSMVTVLPSVARFDAGEELRKQATDRGIPFFRPISLSSPDFIASFEKTKPSIIVVMSFLRKIPREVIEIAPLGGINAHPALLPRYRGAIPYFWAIYKGDKKTGVTLHDITDEFDAGDMYEKEEIQIDPEETTGTLALKCYAVGLKLLAQTLQKIKEGKTLARVPQDPKLATYAPLPDSTVLEIDWTKPAQEILALIRAASPFLGAFTYCRNLQLRIWSARLSRQNSGKLPPGTVITSHGKLEVAAPDQLISLETLQLEMLRFYSGAEFISSFAGIRDGELLGRRP